MSAAELHAQMHQAAAHGGFAAVELIEQWPKVVGSGLARRCDP